MIEIGGQAEPLETDRFPKLLRQAHDAEIIDLSKDGDGAYAVRLREEAGAPVPLEPEPVGADDFDEANDPPMPASSAPPSIWPASPAPAPSQGVGGVPSRSARFRRGSRGPRTAPPEIPKIGVVEVDPNFKPRIELIPTRPVVTENVGTDLPPAPPAPLDEGRRQRSGGGRGGRARRGDTGDTGDAGGGVVGRERDRGDRGERPERGQRGERSERGERGSRSRRGGRGRGGRGRSGAEERYSEERASAPQDAAAFSPPAPEPPAEEPVQHPGEHEGGGSGSGGGGGGGGESFWSKVKRGLTGGA